MSMFTPVATPVGVDQPCIKCGYSLRGLNPAGVCPECGTPVERSLRGDLLIYSDEGYIRTLLRGVNLVMAAILLMVLMVVIAMALGMAGAGAGATTLTNLFGLIVSACFLVGWWLFTTPDAGQLTANKGERPRQIVRICVPIAAALKVIATVLPIVVPIDAAVAGVVQLLDSLIFFVAYFAGMLYLRWLAPRIPSERIYRRAKTLMILLGVVVGLYIVTAIVGFLFAFSLLRGGGGGAQGGGAGAFATMVPVMVVGCGAALLGLVTLVMYYNLFSWLRKDLKQILAGMTAA